MSSPKEDTSDLGKSLATWMTRGPRGLQDFMCSTMSSLPVCGPVYVRSTCKRLCELSASQQWQAAVVKDNEMTADTFSLQLPCHWQDKVL